MEIIIIVLLLASLFGVWLVSVRCKLEIQEENIRNAMQQTLVQLSAEREALEALAELLGHTMDAENLRKMKFTSESAQNAEMTGMPEWIDDNRPPSVVSVKIYIGFSGYCSSSASAACGIGRG